MLINDIINYLSYLKNECRLSVSVHFREKRLAALPGEFFLALIPYNRHEGLYCMDIKRTRQNDCIVSQRAIYAGAREPHLRVCHAGVKEYIHPIVEEESVIGFIAVSGYREKSASQTVGALWESALWEEAPPIPLLEALIPPLAHMLESLFSRYAVGDADEYGRLLTFLHEHRRDATLDDVCRHLHRSRSYVSRLFNQKAGVTLRVYMNELKLEDARALLRDTRLSVTEIAYAAGFGDTSYFIKLFKEKHGVSPLCYRKQI